MDIAAKERNFNNLTNLNAPKQRYYTYPHPVQGWLSVGLERGKREGGPLEGRGK
jgi:hypothetical protein